MGQGNASTALRLTIRVDRSPRDEADTSQGKETIFDLTADLWRRSVSDDLLIRLYHLQRLNLGVKRRRFDLPTQTSCLYFELVLIQPNKNKTIPAPQNATRNP